MINVLLLHRALPFVGHAPPSPPVAHPETLVHLTIRLGRPSRMLASSPPTCNAPWRVFMRRVPSRHANFALTTAQDPSGWSLAGQVASYFMLGCWQVWLSLQQSTSSHTSIFGRGSTLSEGVASREGAYGSQIDPRCREWKKKVARVVVPQVAPPVFCEPQINNHLQHNSVVFERKISTNAEDANPGCKNAPSTVARWFEE